MYYSARLGGNNMTKDELILFERNTILLKENRLLGERCNQLLKDKGELTDKIADIKANCDLAIEGRDVKIKELEQELTVEKDQHQEEINLHLHAEDYIKELEKENAELKAEIENDRDLPTVAYMQGAEKQKKKDEKQLAKAKDLIENIIRVTWGEGWNYSLDWKVKAEQFLKENGGKK